MHKRKYLLFLHDLLSLLFKRSKLQAPSFLWGVVRFGSNTLSSFLSLIRLYQPISVGSVFHSVSCHSFALFEILDTGHSYHSVCFFSRAVYTEKDMQTLRLERTTYIQSIPNQAKPMARAVIIQVQVHLQSYRIPMMAS